jgi:AraC-like DNA-binding protein
MPDLLLTPDDPALTMTYPGFVFRALCRQGHAAEALLAGTGLSADQLVDPNHRCEFAPLRRLLMNAIRQSGDPHLGLRLARQFEPTYIGLPAYAAMNAASFRDALAVLNRFFAIAFPAVEFDHSEVLADPGRHEAAVCLRPRFAFDGIEYFARISALIACEGLFRGMLRMDRVVDRIETAVGEPEGWADVRHEIDYPVVFGAGADRLVFPTAYLDRPLPAHDPVNHTRLTGLCETFALALAIKPRAAAQVLAFLERQPALTASVAEVALALGYSERNLRRQLERSGTSYRKLFDEVRANRARSLLGTTDRAIQTIAFDLGFETPSNFARSFRRWTGVSPKAYRDGCKTPRGAGRN